MNHVADLTSYQILLQYCLNEYASLPCMSSAAESLSYAGWIERVRQIATELRKMPQRYVVLRVSSPITYAAAYFGIVLAGKIACLLPPNQDIPGSLKDAYWATDEVVAMFCSCNPLPLDDFHTDDSNEPCTIAFSSGTSAQPKGVVLSQANLLQNAQYGMRQYRYWVGERLVHLLPYWHLFGIVADLLAPLQAGCSLYMVENTLEYFSALRTFRPHSVNVPPALADTICRAIESINNPLPITGGCLVKMMCAGAPLSIQTTHKMLKYNIKVCAAYGLTECSPCVSLTSDDDVRPGTSGKPLGCVEVRIADDGEILVRGSTIMAGYLGDADATKERIRNGWLYTGDLGYLDEMGHLVISGRKSSMLVFSNGIKCIPEAVEGQIVASDSGVDECLLSVSDGAKYAVLEIFCQGEKEINRTDIDSIMRQHDLIPYELVIRKEKLERNAMGKVVRANDNTGIS